MNFADCLLEAVKVGELDQGRADVAIERWNERVRYHERQAKSPADARAAATEDVVASITKAVQRDRHIKARQLQVLQRNMARYVDADPGLLEKDLYAVKFEGEAIYKMRMAALGDMLEHHRRNVRGKIADKAGLQDLARELHGEDSGNIRAKGFAEAVKAEREWMRGTLNSLGADIGELADYGVAHSHDAIRIRKAGFQAWFDDLYENRRLDWSRIENFATGKPFAIKGSRPLREDAEAFLKPIYEDIVSRDWVDRTPGFSMGTRSLYNDGSHHRVLHFASTDDWWAYNEAFGSKNLFDALQDEFRGRAMDIARMRHFGPSPKAGIENAIQVLEKSAATKPWDGTEGNMVAQAAGIGVHPTERVRRVATTARLMHATLSGAAGQPANEGLATMMAYGRGYLTAVQLGRASISQIGDLASMRNAARAAGLSKNAPILNAFKALFSGATRRQAKELGFILESDLNASAAQARLTGNIWQPAFTNQLSNATLTLNGMTAINNAGRRATAMGLGSDLAEYARLGWDDLDPLLRRFMEENEISARDWDHLRDPRVIYTDRVGGRHIVPVHFRQLTDLPAAEADDLAIRLGAMFENHLQFAIPGADLKAVAVTVGRAQPGSVVGELVRSGLMYKSTAVSNVFNLVRQTHRIGGGLGAKAAFVVTSMFWFTMAGALTIQLKEIAKGRDPQNMNPFENPAFWLKAFTQGGGIGILGDLFTSATSRTGGGLHETVAGPVIGAVSDAGRFLGNFERLASGKETHFGRDAVNLARRYNPVATLLPTALAMDRLLWDQMQDMFDPDARADWRRLERKLKREQGSQSWWRRGDALPARAPDISNAFGGTP